MGVTFSEPRSVKGDTLLLATSSWPTDKEQQSNLWDLWKESKDEIKNDGFAIGKDKGVWIVKYWHEVNGDLPSEKARFKKELDKKVAKWNPEEKMQEDSEESDGTIVIAQCLGEWDD